LAVYCSCFINIRNYQLLALRRATYHSIECMLRPPHAGKLQLTTISYRQCHTCADNYHNLPEITTSSQTSSCRGNNDVVLATITSHFMQTQQYMVHKGYYIYSPIEMIKKEFSTNLSEISMHMNVHFVILNIIFHIDEQYVVFLHRHRHTGYMGNKWYLYIHTLCQRVYSRWTIVNV
jgi:hypothetical protein